MKKPSRYVPLPNEIFSLGLTPGEISVYTYLLFCASRKSNQCWPSYRKIGGAVSMSINTVHKYICFLVDKGLISTENTSVITGAGIKRNGNLRYTIRPIREVMEEFHQRQLRKLA